jgi:hypothetical protein
LAIAAQSMVQTFTMPRPLTISSETFVIAENQGKSRNYQNLMGAAQKMDCREKSKKIILFFSFPIGKIGGLSRKFGSL